MSITPVIVYVFMNFKLLIFIHVAFWHVLLRRVTSPYALHSCITFFSKHTQYLSWDNVTALENKNKKKKHNVKHTPLSF